MGAEVPVPEVGFELVDERGIVIGMAELAWVEKKTTVFLADQEEDRARFSEAGWQVFELESIAELLNYLQDSGDKGES